MGTYTPSTGQNLGPRPCWPINQPLLRLEVEQTIPEPIKFEEDVTEYTIPAEQSLATTSVGTGWIEAGKEYMLLVMVRYELDKGTDDLKISVLERSTGSNVVMDGSLRDTHERQNPPEDHYGTYNFSTKFTAGSSNTNGPIVFIEHTAGVVQCTQGYAQLILIDLTNMTEGNDYFYEENSTDAANTTSLVTRESATLNLTKDNEGAWLLGTAVQYLSRMTDDFQATTIILNQDSGVVSGDLLTYHAAGDDDEIVVNYTTVVNNDLSDTSWNINVYTSDETADDSRPAVQNLVQHAKVWGIRLGRYVSTTFQNHISVDTSDDNNVKVTASELTSVPVEFDSPKFLVLHGGLGKLNNVGGDRKNQRFFTDIQWKKNGGTYDRFGDDDQQVHSTLVWKGNGLSPKDFDSEISWWSTIPPETLSSIKSGDVLSFKLEIWKDTPQFVNNAREVACEDVYLAVVELPQNLNRDIDSDSNYSLKANHIHNIVGPTTLSNCINVRNKLLESRGFMPPKRWDTVWTKKDITLR